MQNVLFGYYTAIFDADITQARRTGTFNEGVRETMGLMTKGGGFVPNMMEYIPNMMAVSRCERHQGEGHRAGRSYCSVTTHKASTFNLIPGMFLRGCFGLQLQEHHTGYRDDLAYAGGRSRAVVGRCQVDVRQCTGNGGCGCGCTSGGGRRPGRELNVVGSASQLCGARCCSPELFCDGGCWCCRAFVALVPL